MGLQKYLGISLLSFSFAAYGTCIGSQNANVTTYSFYVVPQLAISDTYLAWTPVLDRVGKKLNLCFDLKVLPGIPTFERDLLAGKPDFAFMNPYHLLPARTDQGYIPIIADGKNQLSGIIVVKKDSAIKSIQDLNGKKMAFPAPNAMAASLLIRVDLNRNNIKVIPEFVKTHGNVYRAVLVGDYIAGGGVNNTLKRESPVLQNQLRILYETQKITPHPIAAHPRVPTQIRQAVARTFVELGKDPSMAEQLDRIQIPQPMEVSYERNYQKLENLGLEKFLEKPSD